MGSTREQLRGVGLLASAHLLAAVGGGGMLEVDANANPLRTRPSGALGAIDAGHARLGNAPGIGIDVDPAELRALCAAG
ncbi:MAG: hypothetical protein ABI330_07605 [Caldimonas sp.]